MSAEKMIKSEAKRALSGNWVGAVTVLFVSVMVPVMSALIIAAAYTIVGDGEVGELLKEHTVGAFVFVGLNLAAVAALLLLLPIWCGVIRFFGKAAAGEEAEVLDVFYFIESASRYKKAVAFMAGLAVKCLAILIVCTLPAIAIAVIGENDDVMIVLAIILAAVGVILAFLWAHRFAFSAVLFSYKDYDPSSAVKTGAAVAKGNTGKLVKLTVSAIPWYLSLFLIVPFMYAIPYLLCAYNVSIKYIVNDYFEQINNTAPMNMDVPQVQTDPVPVPQAGVSDEEIRNPFEPAAPTAIPEEKTQDNAIPAPQEISSGAHVSLEKKENGAADGISHAEEPEL